MCLSAPDREGTMLSMRRLTPSVLLALFFTPLATAAQVGSLPEQTTQASAQNGVTFDILSDTKGTQLNSYLGPLAPELQQSFLSHLSAADAKSLAHEQVDLLLTIGARGEISALRLAPGTQASLVAKAAWAAVRDTKYGSLPTTLGGSDLTLRVHFIVA